MMRVLSVPLFGTGLRDTVMRSWFCNATAQYAQTNLASSIPFPANFLDPNLFNPTGIALGR
jgi:hypothetical protein